MNNLLIIGNGFDLAHKLPTQYSDFMKFVIKIGSLLFKSDFSDYSIYSDDMDFRIADKVKVDTAPGGALLTEKNIWEDLICNNVWIRYFLQLFKDNKYYWSGFEDEIKNVVELLSSALNNPETDIEHTKWYCSLMHEIVIERMNLICPDFDNDDELNRNELFYRSIVSLLEEDLSKLECALQLYMKDYVAAINDITKQADISNIIRNSGNDLKIFSFNYTDTLVRNYNINPSVITYIHGCASGHCVPARHDSSVVLGIDEMNNQEGAFSKLFIPFQKFYRREYKSISHDAVNIIEKLKLETDLSNRNKDFVLHDLVHERALNSLMSEPRDLQTQTLRYEEIEKEEAAAFSTTHPIKHVYVFGHSLAVSDREYFTEFLLNPYSEITIYYHNQASKREMMQNLILIIGNEAFRRRVGQNQITFEAQK